MHGMVADVERDLLRQASSKKLESKTEGNKMVKIPEVVQEFLKNKMAWVASASPDGLPNVTPKGTVQVLDDEHLVFADLFSLKTRENLQKNPKAAVTVVDEKTHKGYQLKGSVELISSGPLFEKVAEQLEKKSKQLPKPKCVVKITVDSVYDQSVGPEAGKQIA
jgi:predicted pyridoxine 5'-phosphate oxidase superfamily flavin-nucleotide-binding protein